MDPSECLRWLASNAFFLGNLTSELTDPAVVSTYLVADDLWIGSEDFGVLRTNRASRDLEASPQAGVDEDGFKETFVAAWIPQIHQFWGRQVLHSSTVLKTGHNELVAFSGDKRSGKSTLAFGLAQRHGWRQLGDDMLIFEVAEGGVTIIPYPESPRLRPQSSAYFGTDDAALADSEWPEGNLSAEVIYTLSPETDLEEPIRIVRLSGADAYNPLLRQAFNLGLELPDLKRRLIEDYAAFINQARVYRLAYRQEIELLPRILDAVEAHADSA